MLKLGVAGEPQDFGHQPYHDQDDHYHRHHHDHEHHNREHRDDHCEQDDSDHQEKASGKNQESTRGAAPAHCTNANLENKTAQLVQVELIYRSVFLKNRTNE